MRTIALEEHCLTPELRELLGAQIHPYYPTHRWPPALEAQLADIGAGRIADMDAHGIDMQVLSEVQPGLEHSEAARAVPVARAFNDRVAAAVAAHPDRFAAFAALATTAPEEAARELERTVAEFGFKGALFNGRAGERFLDHQDFWPIYEAAEALGVPLYLHTMPAPKAVSDAYYAGLDEEISFMLAGPAIGWHYECGIHALRLILAGVFDRFPNLQLIIGHDGEMLPVMLDRLDVVLSGRTGLGAPRAHTEMPIIEYFKRNFHLTTSGLFTVPPFRAALEIFGAERIMFAVDYPFATNAEGRAFLDALPVTEPERELIAHTNAERLLKL